MNTMKKLTLAIIGLLTLASCEKTYTCTCTYPNATIGTTKTEIKAKKRADAEAACNTQNTAAQVQGGSCAL